jgi:VWFA-related protein
MRRPFAAALTLLALSVPLSAGQAPTGGGAQAPRPAFRSGVRLIAHPVTVKDKSGKPLEGLTAEDFIVTEDGQPQQVAFCEFQRLEGGSAPAATSPEAAAAPAMAPGVDASIERDAALTGRPEYRNHRLVVLYLDLSSLGGATLVRAVRQAAEYVLERMTAADLVAVMTFDGGSVRLRQAFTSNRETLASALGAVTLGGDENGDGIADVVAGTAFGQNDAELQLFNTDRQLAALQTAVAMLRDVREQKTMIYLTGGIRLNGIDNQALLRATINEAIRANATINPVDARGLVATPPLGDATTASPAGTAVFTGAQAQSLNQRLQASQDTLNALARDTGGHTTLDDNNLAGGIATAVEAVSSYYILGYYSQNTKADGRFRRVRVTLRGGRQAQLSYHDGYFADRTYGNLTRAERERQLEDAMTMDNPITDLGLSMEINYFRLNDAEYFVPVTLRLSGEDLARARGQGAGRTVIDFIGEIKDTHGVTYRNVRDKVELSFDTLTAAQLPSRPLLYGSGFTLLPGEYVIKMLAREATTGRIGTYQASFSVPNLGRESQRLPISSVVLGSQRASANDALFRAKTTAVTDAVDPLIHDGQRLVPSVTRVFRTSQQLHVYLQAYPPQAANETIAAFVTLYRQGTKVLESAPAIAPQESRSVSLRVSLSLDSLPSGSYDCQVTVASPAGGKVAFWRAPIVVLAAK